MAFFLGTCALQNIPGMVHSARPGPQTNTDERGRADNMHDQAQQRVGGMLFCASFWFGAIWDSVELDGEPHTARISVRRWSVLP